MFLINFVCNAGYCLLLTNGFNFIRKLLKNLKVIHFCSFFIICVISVNFYRSNRCLVNCLSVIVLLRSVRGLAFCLGWRSLYGLDFS